MKHTEYRVSKTRDLLQSKSPEEIQFIIGRYASPGAVLLSIKEFGFNIHRKTAQEVLLEKSFESTFLDVL